MVNHLVNLIQTEVEQPVNCMIDNMADNGTNCLNLFHPVQILEKDCKARGLNREDAMDRSRWRKQIGMIDDHNECEWVNVSSGTGSPRLSQTKPKEP